MKAARVQGAGAVFARISRRFGLLGQKGADSVDIGRVDDVAEAGADAGKRTLIGRCCCCGASSADIVASSSASQSAVDE